MGWPGRVATVRTSSWPADDAKVASLAARAGGDQQRRGQHDRRRQRDGDQSDRGLHRQSFMRGPDRDADHRASASQMMQADNARDLPGAASPWTTLIDSTVSVTTGTATARRTPARPRRRWSVGKKQRAQRRPSKPTAPGDRIMVEILQDAGESPATSREFRNHHRQYCGGSDSRKWRNRGKG